MSHVNPELLTSYADGIHAIDALYVRPGMVAIHLIVEKGRAAFFDCGTNASMPQVLGALESLGVATGAVDYVIPSHVHLDHAGGAGAMMAAFPNARLVVHARGARHMADPAKLMAATREVYGDAATSALYGELVPVKRERIIEAADGMALDLAGRRLTLLDTPGHAKHHICLVDSTTGHVFSGDAFGFSYRELDVGGRAFVFPSTSPAQFDPQAMHASIERILALKPAAVYVTHFSRVTDIERLGADLHRLVDLHCALARGALAAPEDKRPALILDGLRALLMHEKAGQGWELDDAALFSLFDDELDVNAQGLVAWSPEPQQ